MAFSSSTKPSVPGNYQNWHYARVAGGANNLVYRVVQGEAFAVKFCIRDERDRAGREHAALSLLREHGERLAPEPVLLERKRYFRPVVVQTWLDGEVLEPP